MSELIPDLTGLVRAGMAKSRRLPDGKLHCSTDLVGSVRHMQLRAAGAPELPTDVVGDTILEIGTLWHKRVGQLLEDSGACFMREVDVSPWLPDGWGGTVDWLFWNNEYKAFVLGDLKTTQGESIPFIVRDGIKKEHHHQLSAYWHALANGGFPILDRILVLYWPKNRAKNYDTEPQLIEAKPLDYQYMNLLMQERKDLTDAFLAHYFSEFDYEGLAPEQERELKPVWIKDRWEVKLVPHWSTRFCPFPDDLCACNTQGETKVGEWVARSGELMYIPRKGYEDVEVPELTNEQRRRYASSI